MCIHPIIQQVSDLLRPLWQKAIFSGLLLVVPMGLLALPTLAGCKGPEPESSTDVLKILCTTEMLAEPVRRLVPPEIQVEHLMGSGVDPHLYKPTPKDLRKILRADLVFYHGHHLEGRMSEMLSQLEENSPTVKAIAICEKVPAVDLILDESGTVDPHFWLDVPLWLKVCASLKSALLESGQLPIDDLNRRHSELVSDLEALHQSVISTLASIPSAKRVLVTAHDAFAYFGNRYEFEVHGIQGISTESEPSLKRVNQLVKLLSERKIPAIFVESTVPERNVLALIEGCQKLGHQLTVGGKLYSDAPGPPESGADSWSKMVRHNAQTIAEGLR